MKVRLFTVAALIGLASGVLAEVRWGQVEIAFFRVRNESGQMVDLPTKGIVLPVRMERISARPIGQPRPPVSFQGNLENPLATLVYENDRGTNYFYDPDGPSALDDINILPSGNGQWWSALTLGVNTAFGNSVRVMNRQLGWERFTAGRGPGVSAFDQIVFDVGWVFQPSQFPPGSWKYTIPIQSYWSQIPGWNMPRVPNGLIYFAQEWRAYHTMGEGAFLTGDFSPVFSGDGDPTVGFSLDGYYNDWDPSPNGIFDETEFDYFGGPPNQANFLMSLTVQQAGTTDVVRPTSVSIFRGRANGGNVGSLHFVDQNYYKVNAGLVLNALESPVTIIAEGFSSTANLTALSVDLMSKVNSAGLLQKIDLYNFVTNQWVNIDQRNATMTDTRITVGAPGTARDYVDAANGNIVRMRISYKPFGPVTQAVWGCSIDLGNWLATHP